MRPLFEAQHKFHRWVAGSIRRKLTVFVALICLMLVGVFWAASVYMLQPSYNNVIRRDLSSTLNTARTLLDNAVKQGVPLYDAVDVGGITTSFRLSEELVAILEQAQTSGQLRLDSRCLDIADTQSKNLLLAEGLAPRCLLHQSHEAGLSADGVIFTPERNGTLITLIRAKTLSEGYYYDVLDGGQMVMAATTADGRFVITVSANLERIPQAVNVLKKLLIPISVVLVLFSMFCAWMFSIWFTRPLQRLSGAARQMTRGDYDVNVTPIGNDEIATLTRDFNIMAKEVKRSADVQKDLIANVSHDLRTPLTLIKGYAETVRDLTGDDAEKRTEQLDVIVDETDRLSRLVNSVMELSRMSSGIEKPELLRFDLWQLCDEVGYRYTVLAAQSGGSFVFEGEENCEVVADPALLERVLHNMLGNAFGHVGSDGYVGLTLKKQGRLARVEIADHGPGIPPDDIPYIFDRYYRSRTDEGKRGTGLGLSISKAILSAHGFDFGVDSELGEGSTFWFCVPLAPPQKKADKSTDNPKNQPKNQ